MIGNEWAWRKALKDFKLNGTISKVNIDDDVDDYVIPQSSVLTYQRANDTKRLHTNAINLSWMKIYLKYQMIVWIYVYENSNENNNNIISLNCFEFILKLNYVVLKLNGM